MNATLETPALNSAIVYNVRFGVVESPMRLLEETSSAYIFAEKRELLGGRITVMKASRTSNVSVKDNLVTLDIDATQIDCYYPNAPKIEDYKKYDTLLAKLGAAA